MFQSFFTAHFRELYDESHLQRTANSGIHPSQVVVQNPTHAQSLALTVSVKADT
jgi:hypothetical protein